MDDERFEPVEDGEPGDTYVGGRAFQLGIHFNGQDAYDSDWETTDPPGVRAARLIERVQREAQAVAPDLAVRVLPADHRYGVGAMGGPGELPPDLIEFLNVNLDSLGRVYALAETARRLRAVVQWALEKWRWIAVADGVALCLAADALFAQGHRDLDFLVIEPMEGGPIGVDLVGYLVGFRGQGTLYFVFVNADGTTNVLDPTTLPARVAALLRKHDSDGEPEAQE